MKRALKNFPWASLGRREVESDFFAKLEQQRSSVRLFEDRPLISIIIPISQEFPESHFKQCLSALVLQSYPHWEVLFIAVKKYSSFQSLVREHADERFIWVEAPDECSPLELKNLGLGRTHGEWVGILDPQDVLSPIAFYQMLLELRAQPETDILYTNEACLGSGGKNVEGFLSKPEYSWFNLIHFNYIGRFWFARRSLIQKSEGFRDSAGAHHEHDLFLRLSEGHKQFRCLPFFLYYRRSKPEEQDLPRLTDVVHSHLERLHWEAEVMTVKRAGRTLLKVKPSLKEPGARLISAIICFRDEAESTLRCLESLLRQRGSIPLEIILVNNESQSSEWGKVNFAISKASVPVRVIDYPFSFNFAHMNNLAVRQAKGDFILFLNNDVFWLGQGGLDQMVAWAQQDWVGTVGMLLKYSSGAIQHAGFRGVFGGHARLARIGHVRDENDFAYANKEVFGNTFAACLVKRKTFDELGGLRELELANGFGDAVFNFECLRRGLKNIYLGHVEATHLESASRGVTYEYWEEFSVERQYPEVLEKMLRWDLGYNRVPAADGSLSTFLRHELIPKVLEKAVWLHPLKPVVKRWVRALFPKASHA